MLVRILIVIWIAVTATKDVGSFVSKFKKHKGKRANKPLPLPRIVNGFEVKPHFSFSYMTFLRIDKIPDKEYLCGATLLNSKYAVTAAHCVDPEFVKSFAIFVHRHNKALNSKKEGGSAHRLAALKIHEKYKVSPEGVPVNDIAILKLSTPARKVDKFVRLATPKTTLPSTKKALTVIGWGLTFTGGENSDELQMTDTLHLTNKCYSDKPGLKKNLHICALGDFGTDACTNDSGGPLLLPVKNGYIQIGIVSTGAACGVFGEPGIYTKVSTQFNWISKTVKNLK